MPGLYYRLNVDAVLNRLRFTKLLNYVGERHGRVGELLVEQIVLHGRLRFGTVVEQARERERELIAEAAALAGGGEGEDAEAESESPIVPEAFTDEDAQKVFESLVQQRFIVLVPPLDIRKRESNVSETVSASRAAVRKIASLFDKSPAVANGPTSGTSRQSAAKRARAQAQTNRADAEAAGDEYLPVELRMMMSAGEREGEATGLVRRRGTGDEDEDWDEEEREREKRMRLEDGPGAGRGGRGGRVSGRGSRGGRGGRGAKRETDESIAQGRVSPALSESSRASGTSVGGALVRPEAYWAIGFDQVVREERHRACVEIVTDQLEALAGDTIKVMLAQSMSQELGANPAKSTPMGVGEVFARLKDELAKKQSNGAASSGSASTAKIDLATLKKLLDVMRLSSLGTVVKVILYDTMCYYVMCNNSI